MSVASPSTLNTNLMVKGFSKLLQMKALQEDVFMSLNENYSTTRQKMPDAIYLTVNDIKTEEHTHTIGMLMPLSGNPTYGSANTPLGSEENQVTKSLVIYKNDYSHAVTNQLFGLNAQDKKFYQLLEKETDQLGLYFRELEGLHIRQALLERYSENLAAVTATPTYPTCTYAWNSNWLVKNLAESAQPVYSSNASTFASRIGTALNTAGTSSSATWDFKYLSRMVRQASDIKKLKSIKIKNRDMYVVTVPSDQAMFLKDPTVSNTYGNMWIQYNRMTDMDMTFPNTLGIFGNLLLIEDPRYPVVFPTGSSYPNGLAPRYMRPGNNDERQRVTGERSIGFCMGMGPIVKWDAEKLHFEIETALTYGKRRGHGAFGTYGIQRVEFDAVTPDDTTIENFSSMVLAAATQAGDTI